MSDDDDGVKILNKISSLGGLIICPSCKKTSSRTIVESLIPEPLREKFVAIACNNCGFLQTHYIDVVGQDTKDYGAKEDRNSAVHGDKDHE